MRGIVRPAAHRHGVAIAALAAVMTLFGAGGALGASAGGRPAKAAPDPPTAAARPAYLSRPPTDDIIYFLLPDRFANGDPANDRGGLHGGRLRTGFDPTSKWFYHGGDLRGLAEHLDYIRSLGATALWIAPIFKNQPVQGPPGHESAAYHGYWITDFTSVDPHFGTAGDLRRLVDAAHARGLKVYLDIVVNHTADVIRYRECPQGPCPYRSRADYPYQRRGGVHGAPINTGFLGDGPSHRTTANFSRLTDPDYAYTPYVPAGEEHLKVPDWLNDPIYYHNRGNSTFHGESSTMGDFSGLDDLMTENPRVVRGFIQIYGRWIDDYRIDGFRIDTAKHVDAGFWRAFVPAMRARAAAHGIDQFYQFGEVAEGHVDPALTARYTRIAGLPAVLDFSFAIAVRDLVTGRAGPRELARVFADDPLYAGGAAGAARLATFVSNHDQGRLAYFVEQALPGITARDALRRVELGYALLLTLRGVPVIYYGDEQGFVGTGGDVDARQDMFPTRTAEYADDRQLGAHGAAGWGSHFDPDHPLYRAIRRLAHLRLAERALRAGPQIVRRAATRPGLFVVSRTDPVNGREIVLAFNTATTTASAEVQVKTRSRHFDALLGHCAAAADAPGSYRVDLAPLSYAVCAARETR